MRALLLALGAALAAAAPATDMVTVGAGVYRPIYPPSPEETEIPMPAFRLDRTPVTNAQFQAFVAANPKWQRGRVSKLYADPGYLAAWAGPDDLGALNPDAPVTGVSWHAARAYCASRGARLPTEAEWEYAAAASATAPDGRSDPAHNQKILEWYARPAPAALPAVGASEANYWGAHDLHGLVWEWVEDFNGSLVTSDSRGGDDGRFCGAGAQSAGDKDDYASFMRIAFRSSLEASYTTKNLGFRCAADLE